MKNYLLEPLKNWLNSFQAVIKNDLSKSEDEIKFIGKDRKNIGFLLNELSTLSIDTGINIIELTEMYCVFSLRLNQSESILCTSVFAKSLYVCREVNDFEKLTYALRAIMHSGLLKSDEFNQLMEVNPYLVRVVCENMGISVSQLREDCLTNGIDSMYFIEMIKKSNEEINQMFGVIKK